MRETMSSTDGAPDLPSEAQSDVVEECFDALEALFIADGCKINHRTGKATTKGITRGRATTKDITRKSLDDPTLWAPSPQYVLDVLNARENDFASHDEFVRVLAWIKASLGPDREQYYGDVEHWALGYGGNNPAYVRERWDSIRDAVAGWDALTGITGTRYIAAQAYFDDETSAATAKEMAEAEKAEAERARITLAPFVLRDPATIPPREWLYGFHCIRGYLSVTVAPGGMGKSSLALVEALAMVTGRILLDHAPREKLRVLYWNGEDPLDEIERRVAATCLQYHIRQEDLADRLFISSGRNTQITIATEEKSGLRVSTDAVAALRHAISENRIDLVILDPFVACHAVSENDNNKINAVCRQLAMVADETRCSIELVHHTRKAGAGQNEHTADDARGASSIVAAARSVRVLNRMTKDEATRAGIEKHWSFFRVDNGKANLAPPPEKTSWRQIVSVPLGNGRGAMPEDSIGVVTPWTWPDPSEGIKPDDIFAIQEVVAAGEWRDSTQATNWVGNAVAEALHLDLSEPCGRATAKALIRSLLANGHLRTTRRRDASRKERTFVEVGKKVSQ
jgi:hypothetical protein